MKNKIEKIYSNNMLALKEFYPELAKKIECQTDTGRFSLVKSNNGINLSDSFYNELYYNTESKDILEDVRLEIEKLKTNNARIAIMFGFGLGYSLHIFNSYIAAKEHTAHYFIIERDLEVLKYGLHTTDISVLIRNKKISFFIGIESSDLFSAIADDMRKNPKYIALLRAFKVIYTEKEFVRNSGYYKEAIRAFRDATVYSLINVGNSVEDSLMGVENMLVNINEIIENPGINMLCDKFKGKPAIVVSTGPSLNKNKHLLEKVKDKAVIIAADSALKILLDIGIKPHMITMLERTIGPHKHVQGFTHEEVKDIYLAACPVVNNISYQVYNGPRIIVYRTFDHFKWLGIERGILPIKASSGNMSFKVAEALGCDPIIMIGQDLAYSDDNKTHAKGMVLGEEYHGVTKIYKDFYIKGNYVDQILTNESWHKFLLGYVDDVAHYSGRCINATEGGAYIHGTELMTFQEAIDQCIVNVEPFDALKEIKTVFKEFTENDSVKDAHNFIEIVESSLVDMKFIVDTCNEGIDEYNKHYARLMEFIKKSDLDDDEFSELKEIQKNLVQLKNKTKNPIVTFQLLFMHIIQPFIVTHEIKLTRVTENVLNKRIAMANQMVLYIEFFKVLRDVAKIVIDLVETSKVEVIENMKKYSISE